MKHFTDNNWQCQHGCQVDKVDDLKDGFFAVRRLKTSRPVGELLCTLVAMKVGNMTLFENESKEDEGMQGEKEEKCRSGEWVPHDVVHPAEGICFEAIRTDVLKGKSTTRNDLQVNFLK